MRHNGISLSQSEFDLQTRWPWYWPSVRPDIADLLTVRVGHTPAPDRHLAALPGQQVLQHHRAHTGVGDPLHFRHMGCGVSDSIGLLGRSAVASVSVGKTSFAASGASGSQRPARDPSTCLVRLAYVCDAKRCMIGLRCQRACHHRGSSIRHTAGEQASRNGKIMRCSRARETVRSWPWQLY